jgi:hypothetical protein
LISGLCIYGCFLCVRFGFVMHEGESLGVSSWNSAVSGECSILELHAHLTEADWKWTEIYLKWRPQRQTFSRLRSKKRYWEYMYIGWLRSKCTENSLENARAMAPLSRFVVGTLGRRYEPSIVVDRDETTGEAG